MQNQIELSNIYCVFFLFSFLLQVKIPTSTTELIKLTDFTTIDKHDKQTNQPS